MFHMKSFALEKEAKGNSEMAYIEFPIPHSSCIVCEAPNGWAFQSFLSCHYAIVFSKGFKETDNLT